jgi:hypothetical protein
MRHLPLLTLVLLTLLLLTLPACDDGSPVDTQKAAILLSDLHADPGNYTCSEPAWGLPECVTGTVEDRHAQASDHVFLPKPITYTDSPPTFGPHRPEWAKWGAYKFLPPQTWIHNLEHGGVVLLYHPCTPPDVVAQLRQWAHDHAPDGGGPLRWVLTPYPGLPQPVMAVTWGWRYGAACVRPAELDAFLQAHYRKATEDVGTSGGYAVDWLGN